MLLCQRCKPLPALHFPQVAFAAGGFEISIFRFSRGLSEPMNFVVVVLGDLRLLSLALLLAFEIDHQNEGCENDASSKKKVQPAIAAATAVAAAVIAGVRDGILPSHIRRGI